MELMDNKAALQEKEIWSVCVAIKPLGTARRSLSPKIKLWFKFKSFFKVLGVLKSSSFYWLFGIGRRVEIHM